MNQDNRSRLAALAVALVLAIGLVDAVIGADWDLFAVMGIALGLHLVVLSGLRPDRPAVPIRGDLVVWARERAQRAGEPVGAVLDRAIAHHRDHYGDAPQEARR